MRRSLHPLLKGGRINRCYNNTYTNLAERYADCGVTKTREDTFTVGENMTVFKEECRL